MRQTKIPIGDRLADQIANLVGSWAFITTQLIVIALWAGINIFPKNKVDPYPFQFLNLFLGIQSALTGPMLLIAGKRQEKLDRQRAIENLNVDISNYKDFRNFMEIFLKIAERSEFQFNHLNKDIESLEKEIESL
jgi:uncharacterized membrane protein